MDPYRRDKAEPFEGCGGAGGREPEEAHEELTVSEMGKDRKNER